MTPTPPKTQQAPEQGWNTIELMIAIAIVSVGLMVVVQQVSIGFREAASTEFRTFAYQHASGILREIQNSVDSGEISQISDLYELADETENPVLTTRLDAEDLPVLPDHRMSGNVRRQGRWLWARKLSITPHERPGMAYVRVDILRQEGGRWLFEANQTQLLSVLPETDEPTQTFDVWVLAIGNVPSMLGDLAQVRTALQNAATALGQDSQARCSIHWISRLGFGRDAAYAPFLNTATATAPAAYFLPGLLPDGSSLFHSDLLGGVHRTEAGLVNGWSTTNPFPYALADGSNHCLRAPAARALFDARVTAGLEDPDQPPLQVLLDMMHEDPDRFRGAVFLNLHGNVLPMPPLRPIADPAKDPTGRPGVRVVTHPTRLRHRRDPDGNGNHDDTENVELRVYAWREGPGGAAVLTEPILVQIFGVDLTGTINGDSSTTLAIARLPGGIDPTTGLTTGIGREYLAFDSAAGLPDTTGGAPFAMRYAAGFTSGAEAHTWIKLWNTPLVCPKVGNRGLDPAGRLYGLDYDPSPVTAGGTFAMDLATDSASVTAQRNTARWRLRIPRRAFEGGLLPNADTALRIVTRIGDDTTTGRRWPTPHQPANQSETWTWWTRGRDAVPATERAQFLGDPRLCPYVDFGVDGTTTRDGYNWHFDDLRHGLQDAAASFPCLLPTRLLPGLGSRTRSDAPRLFELLRSALQRTEAVFVNAGGATAEFVALGGEIARAGSVLATTPAAVTVPASLFGGATPVEINHLSLPPALGIPGGAQVLHRPTSNWWARPWLGELVPDADHAAWSLSGNLPTTGPTGFVWRNLDQMPSQTFGTAFLEPTGAGIGTAGAALLLNIGTPAATIAHTRSRHTTATASAPAQAIATATNTALPTTLLAERGVTASTSLGASPPPAFLATDIYPRSDGSTLETLWTAADNAGAQALRVAAPDGQIACFVPIGFTPVAGELQQPLQQALLAALRTVHVAGTPTLPRRQPQLPRVAIVEPAVGSTWIDPAGATLRWHLDFLRFDGQPYTDAYPTDFSEDESQIDYRLLVSRDAGLTWVMLADGSPASSDRRGDAETLLADTGAGDESFTTLLPEETFPAGEYLFRVEAWHRTRQAHSAAHQVRVVLRRT